MGYSRDMTLDITVKRTTAAQQVAEGLSDLIMSGHFAPGARLREAAIAGELRVSRNTVREAVRILELGGLVRHEVNRGAVVISPTRENVTALYHARCQLEVAAVSHPLSLEQIELPRRALDRLVAAAGTKDVHNIVAADLDFHAAIVQMLSSPRIDDFYRELTTELRFYLTVLAIEDREYDHPDEIVAEHTAILASIESGDPAAAIDAIRAHVLANGDRVCQILESRDADPADQAHVPSSDA